MTNEKFVVFTYENRIGFPTETTIAGSRVAAVRRIERLGQKLSPASKQVIRGFLEGAKCDRWTGIEGEDEILIAGIWPVNEEV